MRMTGAMSKMGLSGPSVEYVGPPTSMPKHEEQFTEVRGWRPGKPLLSLTGTGAATHPALKVPVDPGFGPAQTPLDNFRTMYLPGPMSAEELKRLSGFGRPMNPALKAPKDTPTAPTTAELTHFSGGSTLRASRAWNGSKPALGIYVGRSGKPRGALGSLGQWWNPVSWVQTVYTGAQAVVGIGQDANTIANDATTVAGELTQLDTDVVNALESGLMWQNPTTGGYQSYLALLWAQLNSFQSAFSTYHTDFLAAIANLTNYLTGAGSTIETSLVNLQTITKTLSAQLSAVQTTLNTLVSSFDNLANLSLAAFKQETAQWAEFLSEFNQNAANVQQVAGIVTEDLHAMRANSDTMTAVYAQFLTTFQQEYDAIALPTAPSFKAPMLSIPSLKLSGLGRRFGRVATSPVPGEPTAGSSSVPGGPAGGPVPAQTYTTTDANGHKITRVVPQPSNTYVGGRLTDNAAQVQAAQQAAGDLTYPSQPTSQIPSFITELQNAKVASGKVPPVVAQVFTATKPTPLPTSAIDTLAKGLAQLAKAGSGLLSIEDTLVNLANFHVSSQGQILASQEAQLAALTSIHNTLLAQNAALKLPGR
jgi:uncharacterized phage infection (PIP) family protein YhgE